MSARNEFKWALVMLPEAANKVAGWDGSGNPALLDFPAQFIASAGNGIEVVSGVVRLGNNPITVATLLNITTGSLGITGADKPFTLKSNSGFQPKLRIEGDGVNVNGLNWEFEPQFASTIKGLLLKYSTAYNTTATLPSIFFRENGWVGIGAAAAAAALDIVSTTSGLLPPRMTTGQRDAIVTPPDGTVLYNTTTGRHNLRQGGAWVEIGGSAVVTLRQVFTFNSSLYTEDVAMFRGSLTSLSGYFSLELSAVSFEARLDSASSWVALADVSALQTWITSNISGSITSGTKFWVKVLATYGGSATGLAQYVLHYIAT